jgi:hypothetical protein
MEKTEREKAEEILKRRELARKGLSEQAERRETSPQEQEEREEKVAGAAALGLGLKRSG